MYVVKVKKEKRGNFLVRCQIVQGSSEFYFLTNESKDDFFRFQTDSNWAFRSFSNFLEKNRIGKETYEWLEIIENMGLFL